MVFQPLNGHILECTIDSFYYNPLEDSFYREHKNKEKGTNISDYVSTLMLKYNINRVQNKQLATIQDSLIDGLEATKTKFHRLRPILQPGPH